MLFDRYADSLPEAKIPSLTISEFVFEKRLTNDELVAYDRLCSVMTPLSKNNITVFYPGSANDVLFPLLYVRAFFCDVSHLTLFFIDPDLHPTLIAERITQLLGIDLIATEQEENVGVTFRGNGLTVHCLIIDAFSFTDSLLPKSISLYVDRAFGPWREKHPDFISMVQKHCYGFMVTDTLVSDLRSQVMIEDLGFYKQLYVYKVP